MEALDKIAIHTNFGLIDYAIVAIFLVVSTALGVYATRYIKNMDDYVVAGRGVQTYIGIASMIAAEMGLVTVMYSAQMGFANGFSAFAIAALSAIAGFIVGCTGFIVVPLRKLCVMTIPEFYEKRFTRGVRILGAIILAGSGILNMGMFLKVDSMFITSVMGMNSDWQLKIAMSVILLLVLLYTMLGGMMSVVLTDYMQFVVMAISLIAVSVLLMGIFGWTGLMNNVYQIKGDAGFNPLLTSNGMGPSYLVWMLFLGFIGACVWQTSVMRATSAADTNVVRRTYAWGAVGFLIRFLIPYFWGICALVFVFQTPALKAIFLPPGGASSTLQLRAMPVALSRLVPAGAIGILTAGMLAAAMSTYNTYLHTWSAVITQDVIAPLSRTNLSSNTRILLARIIMCFVAVFLLVWGLWYPLGEKLWDYMAVTGAIYFTGAFATLVGGIYWKRASTAGAYAAFTCGFFMLMGLKPVQEIFKVNWPSQNVGLSVTAAAIVAMILFSLLFPNKKEVPQ